MSFFASDEMVSQVAFENYKGYFFIFWKVSSWSLPAKGVVPLRSR